jgi:hypothetical protein
LLQDKQLTLNSEVLLLGQSVYSGQININFPVNPILQVTCQLDSLVIALSLPQLQQLASISNQLNAPPQFGTQSMRTLIHDSMLEELPSLKESIMIVQEAVVINYLV